MRAVSSAVAFMLAVSAVMAAPTAAEAAAPLQCGSVISADTFLTQDLHCTTSPGVTLDGNVTLDLGGHRLSGPGAASPDFQNAIGVALTESGTPRVQNGTISGWGSGTAPSRDNEGFGRVDATFAHVTYADNGSGLVGYNSNFAVTGARFVRNTDAGISGLTTVVTVRHSFFLRNGRGISLSDGGSISLTKSILARNGVAVSCSEVGCAITSNSLRDNGTAIAAFYTGGKITANDIRGNDIGFRTDFDPDPGYAHELARNVFTGNGSGVVVNDLGTAYLHDNTFRANGVGFTVPSPDYRFTARLDRNVFTRNGDGIFVSSAGASLMQNTAVDNERWGIYAAGALDLGGNQASGNGASPQCLGVICG